jgi:uncharacterized membrane protein YphA (DoxX/SURF4 family)
LIPQPKEKPMLEPRLNAPWWALRLAYGLVPIVAGLDKFTNLLTDWTQYLSPLVARVVPASTFMSIVGIIEIAAGVLVLTRWTRIGAYVVGAWLVAIALNLVTTGRYFDIAVRDLVMAVGAFTLARLAELAQPARDADIAARRNPTGRQENPAGGAAHPSMR